jgi:hypothetical protein
MEHSAQLHRERSRRNQRKYRERQQQRIKDLEEQVRTLQETIADQTTSSNTIWHKSSGIPTSASSAVEPPSDHDSSAGTSNSLLHGRQKQWPPTRDIDRSATSWNLAETENAYGQRGRCSPRLVYGIMGDIAPQLSLVVVEPPSDIIPYLPGKPNTLAKILFWKSMEASHSTGLQMFLEVTRGRKVNPNEYILALPFFFDGIKTCLNRVQFRLLFFQGRTVEQDHPGRDYSAAIFLRHKIVKHMRSLGFDDSSWLNATDVEELVHHRLEPWMVSLLMRSILHHTNGSFGVALIKAIDDLAVRSVCFGDGPRWRREVVLGALDTFALILAK